MSLLNQFRVAGCGRPGVSDNWWGQSRSDGQRELLDAESVTGQLLKSDRTTEFRHSSRGCKRHLRLDGFAARHAVGNPRQLGAVPPVRYNVFRGRHCWRAAASRMKLRNSILYCSASSSGTAGQTDPVAEQPRTRESHDVESADPGGCPNTARSETAVLGRAGLPTFEWT